MSLSWRIFRSRSRMEVMLPHPLCAPFLARVARSLLAVLLCAGLAAPALAQGKGKHKIELPGPSDAPRVVKVLKPDSRKPADYNSAHFLLHTDLPAKEANALLRRLETMLVTVSKY